MTGTAKLKISAKCAEALVHYGSGIGDELPEEDRREAWTIVVAQICDNDLRTTGGVLVLNHAALDELADWSDYEYETADLEQHDYSALALGAYKAMMRGLWSRACKAMGQIEEAGK